MLVKCYGCSERARKDLDGGKARENVVIIV